MCRCEERDADPSRPLVFGSVEESFVMGCVCVCVWRLLNGRSRSTRAGNANSKWVVPKIVVSSSLKKKTAPQPLLMVDPVMRSTARQTCLAITREGGEGEGGGGKR